MIRSTCAPTMMQGSDQLNVMPRRPHIDLDCRILPGTGPVALTEMLTEIINDKDVQIQANCEIPVLAEMGLPVTAANGPQWHFVKNSIT
jgi:acetylornithine deacetylase/succinyl-diaminopimelate desuccinylase-like protein